MQRWATRQTICTLKIVTDTFFLFIPFPFNLINGSQQKHSRLFMSAIIQYKLFAQTGIYVKYAPVRCFYIDLSLTFFYCIKTMKIFLLYLRLEGFKYYGIFQYFYVPHITDSHESSNYLRKNYQSILTLSEIYQHLYLHFKKTHKKVQTLNKAVKITKILPCLVVIVLYIVSTPSRIYIIKTRRSII